MADDVQQNKWLSIGYTPPSIMEKLGMKGRAGAGTPGIDYDQITPEECRDMYAGAPPFTTRDISLKLEIAYDYSRRLMRKMHKLGYVEPTGETLVYGSKRYVVVEKKG